MDASAFSRALLILLTLAGRCRGRVAASTARRRPRPNRPNLLFVLTDQQRYDTIRRVQEEIPHFSGRKIDTPNLDRLSWEGAYFRNAYTHCAACGPARTSLLTGHTIENTGVRTNRMVFDEHRNQPGNDAADKIPLLRTYDEILVEDHGYVAGYIGKWHSPECKGFVYGNDLRMAGAVESAWFGKYNPNDSGNATRHYASGQRRHYREWLDEHNISEWEPRKVQQLEMMSHRPYVPDPLDTRYQLRYDPTVKRHDPSHQYGRSLLPDGMSLTAQQGTEAIEALRRLHDASGPFSLHVSFNSPHPPTVATEKYHSMYDPSELSTPASLLDNMTNTGYRGRGKTLDAGYRDAVKVRRWKATYYGLVTEVDEWVGLLLGELDDLGIANNTMVVFTSDHGEMLGSHGLKEKFVFYEESAHIPLLLRFPGIIRPRTVVDAPVSHLGLHSTVLDYLGAEGAYETDGASLRQYVEGNDREDSFVVTAFNFTDDSNAEKDDPAFMIRKGEWKLMVIGNATSKKVDMLINLCTDPYETNNLVGRNSELASEDILGKAEHMKALLVNYLVATQHPSAEEIRRRRDWPSVPFWVGDTVINFRNELPDGTRTEWLYMGTSSDQENCVTNIFVEGEMADLFSFEWESNDVISANEIRVLPITYDGRKVKMSATDTCSALLVIQNCAGEDKHIHLLCPKSTSDASQCPSAIPLET